MTDREGRFVGRVAVVTGGAAGIGFATARAFADEGAQVFIVDLDEDGLARAASELGVESVLSLIHISQMASHRPISVPWVVPEITCRRGSKSQAKIEDGGCHGPWQKKRAAPWRGARGARAGGGRALVLLVHPCLLYTSRCV